MTDGRLSNEELVSEADRRLLKATGETSVQITKRVAEQIAGEWYGLTDCSDNAIIALLVSELATLQRSADEHGGSDALGRANALMMAAAPDLFDALTSLLQDVEEYARINNLRDPEGGPASNHAMRQARAALSKAKGADQ